MGSALKSPSPWPSPQRGEGKKKEASPLRGEGKREFRPEHLSSAARLGEGK